MLKRVTGNACRDMNNQIRKRRPAADGPTPAMHRPLLITGD